MLVRSCRARRAVVVAAVAATLALGPGCAAPGPIAAPDLAAGAAAAPMPAGRVAGLVATRGPAGFRPVAGATVRVGAGAPVVTGPDGRYALPGLAPGSHDVRVAAPGFEPAIARVVVDAVHGVPRANVVLTPAGYGLAQAAGPFDATLSGVVTDPRGAALAGASVHVVDNCANGGAGSNFFVTTDANGFYTATIPAVTVSAGAPGLVRASATAVSPGGVRLDNLSFLSGFLAGPALVLSPQLDVFQAPAAPVITGASFVAPGGVAQITAAGVSTRTDEFHVELTSGGRVYALLPDAVANGTITFRAPFTLPASTFTARVVPFGRPAGASAASPAFASQYLQADFDADLAYLVPPALADGTAAGAELNGTRFVPGDEAVYTVTLANANVAIQQDVRLEGTVPVGTTIAAATAAGQPLAAITQPDGAGRFAVGGIAVPAGGLPVAVAIRFVAPVGLANGAAFQVVAPAVRMPGAGLTKAVAPAIPAALTVAAIDPAGFGLAKALLDDGTSGNGVGRVRLTLTAAGSGAIGAFAVTDRTLTDQAAGAAFATLTGTVAQPPQGAAAGYATGEHLDFSIDGGPSIPVAIFSVPTDLEILLGQINTTAGLQGLVTATRTAGDTLRIVRTAQGTTRTIAILGSSSAGLLTKLGLSAGLVAGSDGILASFANATATQPGGTTWAITPTSNVQEADGSVAVAFTLTPPAAFAAGDGPTAPLTVTYDVVKATGLAMGLGGGLLGAGFGARVPRANLVAPYTDAAKAVALPATAPDPAPISGF